MSKLIIQAKQFAERAHAGQVRKLNDEPFMNHPTNVASTLLAAGFDEIVVAAGYLHDVVEDTTVEIAEISRKFGEKVKALVEANTEDTQLPWKERKRQTIQAAKQGSVEVKALIAADKMDNLTNVLKYEKQMGEKVWSAFSKGKQDQYWYYSKVAEAIFENVPEEEIPLFFYEYKKLVRTLQKIVM